MAYMNPAPQTTTRSMLQHMEDQYNKRIDDDITKLVDCYSDIVKIGEVRKTNQGQKLTLWKEMEVAADELCIVNNHRSVTRTSLRYPKKGIRWKARLRRL